DSSSRKTNDSLGRPVACRRPISQVRFAHSYASTGRSSEKDLISRVAETTSSECSNPVPSGAAARRANGRLQLVELRRNVLGQTEGAVVKGCSQPAFPRRRDPCLAASLWRCRRPCRPRPLAKRGAKV